MVDATRYNTGNELGSNKLEDLSDNAKNIDNFANGESETFPDRFGAIRKSIAGMESEHDAQISAHETEHDNQIARHESEFITHIEGMGWTPAAGSFQVGGTITDRNQTLYDEVSHVFYAWGGTLPKTVIAGSTPATTGGVGVGAWSDKTDLMLRSGLSAYDGFSLIGKFQTISDLRSFSGSVNNGAHVFVRSHTTGYEYGGGEFYYDSTDITSVDNNGTIIVDATGARWKRKIDENTTKIYAVWFGAISSINIDSSSALMGAINEAKRLVGVFEGKRYLIVLPPKIKTASSIYIDPSVCCIDGAGGTTEWRVDPAGTFDDNYALHITGDLLVAGAEGDIPYVNTTIYALRYVYIFEYNGATITNTVNLIKHYSTLNGASGKAEIVSQLGVLKIRVSGFNDVYSNGDNGWGICFWECGFDSYIRAVVLTEAVNNAERITFRECVFQNGSIPCDIYGWTGIVLFDNCSLDYNSGGEFYNRGGNLMVRGGHIETSGRTMPICTNIDATLVGKSKFDGVKFVNLYVDGASVILFNSSRKHSCVVEDCVFSWAENESPGIIATRNLRLTGATGIISSRNWVESGEEGRTVMFAQGVVKSPAPAFVGKTVAGNLSFSRNAGKITITTTDVAPSSKSVEFLVPILGDTSQYSKVSWMSVFSACVLSSNCALTVYLSNSDGSIEDVIGEVYTFGNGTGTLKPANSATYTNNTYTHLKFHFFLDPMLTGNSITIDTMGCIAFN